MFKKWLNCVTASEKHSVQIPKNLQDSGDAWCMWQGIQGVTTFRTTLPASLSKALNISCGLRLRIACWWERPLLFLINKYYVSSQLTWEKPFTELTHGRLLNLRMFLAKGSENELANMIWCYTVLNCAHWFLLVVIVMLCVVCMFTHMHFL